MQFYDTAVVAVLTNLVLFSPGHAFSKSTIDDMHYYVIKLPVKSFIESIAADQNLDVNFAGEIHGSVTKSAFSGDIDDVMDVLSYRYKLDYFVYNNVVHVNPKSLNSTKLFSSENFTSDQVIAKLVASQAPIDGLSIEPEASTNSIVVTGPPTALAIVDLLIKNFTPPPVAKRKRIQIRRGIEVSGTE